MIKSNLQPKPRKHLLGIYFLIGFIPLLLLIGMLIFLINRPTLPTKAVPILFKDDFSSYKTGTVVNNSGGWQDVSQLLSNNSDSRAKSKWFFNVGKVLHEANIPADYTDFPKLFLGTLIVNSKQDLENYVLETRVEALNGEGFGLVFGYKDINNFYRFLVVANKDNGGPYIKFEKKANGTVSTVSESTSGTFFNGNFQVGVWYRLKLVINQDTFEIFLDGKKILSGIDKNYSGGKFGLWSFEQSGVFFDDVIVSGLN